MKHHSDFLVIGSGIAGLMFALKIAEHGRVALITKGDVMESNTVHAQGGIASVFGRLDSFDLHIQDTLTSGDGLCHPDVVDLVVKNGPARIQELMELGVRFNLRENHSPDPGGEAVNLDLGREGGHSCKRIVHAEDLTGKELETVLVKHVEQHPRITLFEHHIAMDLLTRSRSIRRGGVITRQTQRCCGAYVLDTRNHQVKTLCAPITLLATGGTGKVYLYTSNPDVATGDGIAMAYRAGAAVANLEFVQFHPTCMYHPDAKNFLISEAVRGEGGILIDAAGQAFMHKYDPRKDLACRDVVARAIDTELKKSGDESVFLDISHKDAEFIRHRFPNIYRKCRSFGLDMTREPIPVVPAAHYMCGGILTDLNGQTDIEGLYAVGETACTGLHGANRLASNSLLEALVYSHRAVQQAAQDFQTLRGDNDIDEIPEWKDTEGSAKADDNNDEATIVTYNWEEIRRSMWNYVGIVRSDRRLARARRRIEMIQQEIRDYYLDFNTTSDLIELRNIAAVAELIIDCALHRKESRGLHYTIQYPEKDNTLEKNDTILKRCLTD
jgi:L-aspartate oxidase